MNFNEFVIDNCVRQNATEPEDYIGMTRACMAALEYTKNQGRVITEEAIYLFGGYVNNTPTIMWRKTPAIFTNGNHGVAPSLIDHTITGLLAHRRDLTPVEFYHEFERIHPFADGNGRVGAILFNIMTGNFWTNPPEMTW